MGKKYIKCPRCELNYILEGESYCHVCKSEMTHHSEQDDDELLDFDEMDICSVCGTNYIKENETMCSDCRAKLKSGKASEDWEEGESSIVSTDADEEDESEEEYNSGFSDIDPANEELDPYKIDDDVDDIVVSDDSSLDFAMEEEIDETFDEKSDDDDFEAVEISDDDDIDDEDEYDDEYDFDGDDLLGKR